MRRWLCTVLLLSISPALAAEPAPRLVAERVVGQVAAIREGEIVLITAPESDFELASQLAWAVRRRKGDAISLIQRESDERRSYDEVPADLDGSRPIADLALIGIVDAQLNVSHLENPARLDDVAAARKLARAQAYSPVQEAFLAKKGLRYVDVGNGLYPTQALADRFGMTKDALAQLFWASIDIDYDALVRRATSVKAALTGKEAHLTHPNGTDLRVSIAARPISVSDGVISEEDRNAGGAAKQAWLPAGEVYVAPVAGTARGKVVVERSYVDGKEVLGLTMTFKDGKLTAMTARQGLELLKAYYDGAGAGRDLFGVLDIGINPALVAPKGARLQSWVANGTITVTLGGDLWAGGDNPVGFSHIAHLEGASLRVDGRVVVKDGVVVAP